MGRLRSAWTTMIDRSRIAVPDWTSVVGRIVVVVRRRMSGPADRHRHRRRTRVLGIAGAPVIRREHRAVRGQHDFEAGVIEGQIFRVGHPEIDREAFGLRARTALVQQRGNIVGRCHVSEAPRGGVRSTFAFVDDLGSATYFEETLQGSDPDQIMVDGRSKRYFTTLPIHMALRIAEKESGKEKKWDFDRAKAHRETIDESITRYLDNHGIPLRAP